MVIEEETNFLQLVCATVSLLYETFSFLSPLAALAGASATVASDALMNPFDGMYFFPEKDTFVLMQDNSNQAADASAQFRIPFRFHLCQDSSSKGRLVSVLRVISNNTHNECTIHRRTVYRLRICQEAP